MKKLRFILLMLLIFSMVLPLTACPDPDDGPDDWGNSGGGGKGKTLTIICYEGGLSKNGFPKDTRTPQQKERMKDLLDNLLKVFPKAKVVGHRDLPGTIPKECPGF